MIVYLLVHLPTEMSYVGSTELTVEERFGRHWHERRRRDGSDSELRAAMRASKKRDWLRVELERYDGLEAMLNGEREWILELGTLSPGVGYNSQVPRKGDVDARLKREKVTLLAGTTPDTDFFRRCAEEQWASMSDDERELRRQRAAVSGRRWWSSLSPEQRAAHIERAREGGRQQNGSKKGDVS